MTRYVLIGAGGHAKAIAEMIRASGDEVVGYAAPVASDWILSERYEDSRIPPPDGRAVAIGLGGVTVDQLDRRIAVFRRWQALGYSAPPLVHACTVVSGTAALADAVVILAGAVIQPSARIAMAAIINTRAVVEHDAHVGEGAHIAPGAIVLAGARIGRAAMIGANAVVLPGAMVADGGLVKAATRFPPRNSRKDNA